MRVTCPRCASTYDDAERTTLCPHTRFLPPDLQVQKDLALSLIGHPVRWAHSPEGPDMRIQSVDWTGMVTLQGWSGEFAPHCFRRVE